MKKLHTQKSKVKRETDNIDRGFQVWENFRHHRMLGLSGTAIIVFLELNSYFWANAEAKVRHIVADRMAPMLTVGKSSRVVWPSQAKLAKSLGLHRQQVNRAIKELVDFGFIRAIKDGRNNVYEIIL